MKLSTFLVAAFAAISVVFASPVADPKATSPNVAVDSVKDIFARDDCKDCTEYFDKCKNSWSCWINPFDCDRQCREHVCRTYIKCNNKCGFTCRPDHLAEGTDPIFDENTPEVNEAEAAV